MVAARPADSNEQRMSAIPRNLSEIVLTVHQQLLLVYGEQPWCPHYDALTELVNTILSQNTNDRNRDRALAQLRAQFPTWEAVRTAPLAAVVAAIRVAGLAETKGTHIQAALQRITQERGELSLDFLQDMPVDAARAWLMASPGVGPKTAAIVLLFALGRPAFPVDTHVHRVTRRLGLIPATLSREKAHGALEALVPPALYYPLHLNLIAHGRQICHARAPKCAQCSLVAWCDTYQTQIAA